MAQTILLGRLFQINTVMTKHDISPIYKYLKHDISLIYKYLKHDICLIYKYIKYDISLIAICTTCEEEHFYDHFWPAHPALNCFILLFCI